MLHTYQLMKLISLQRNHLVIDKNYKDTMLPLTIINNAISDNNKIKDTFWSLLKTCGIS